MSMAYTQEDLSNEAVWATLRRAKFAETRSPDHVPIPITVELVIDWDKTHHQDGSELSTEDLTTCNRERDIKSREMWLDDKTNPNVVFVENATTLHRYFVDAAAAQEWADFITAQATTYSITAPKCEIFNRVRLTNMAQAVQDRDERLVASDTSATPGGGW